jgi:hypothetical protein
MGPNPQAAWERTLALSDDLGSARDPGAEAAAEPTDAVAGALAAAAVRDLVAMGVGAVMALHSVDRAKAMTTLSRVASEFQIPISSVAQALLTLVAGTDEPFGDGAGRAAAQLLVQGFTSPT